MKNSITFEVCNYANAKHKDAFTKLLKHYMLDPMGDSKPLDETQEVKLFNLLSTHSGVATIFVLVNDKYAGLLNYFSLISTFKAKPYIYIHDVIVNRNFRGNGLGRKLMEKVIDIAKEKDCCKLMLEVREDNDPALSLYSSLGFEECEPKNYSWTKTLYK